jgi:hypothetical protein
LAKIFTDKLGDMALDRIAKLLGLVLTLWQIGLVDMADIVVVKYEVLIFAALWRPPPLRPVGAGWQSVAPGAWK